MASACVKCGGMSFKLEQKEPLGSSVKWYFVQCSSCGTPVGVVDFYPNATIVRKMEALEKALESLEGDVANIDHMIRQLANRLR
jgi:hypothetical protein